MARRAAKRRAPTVASRTPAFGTIARLVERLDAPDSLDLRLADALAVLRDLLDARSCAIEVQVDGAPILVESAAPVRPRGASGEPGVAVHRSELGDADRKFGELRIVPPPRDGEHREVVALVARLIAGALSREQRVRAAGAAVAASAAEMDAQRRFIARIVDSLPVGLYVVDREYRVQAWNRKRETGLQGVPRGDVLGRPVFDVLHRQPAELLRRELDAVFATGTMQQYELETGSASDRRHYRVTKIPMRGDGRGGEVTHVIAIGEDVTERRRAQERAAQSEKLAAVGHLAAGVMHEVNNPLAVIGACAESAGVRLGESDVTPALREALVEYLAIIDHEVQRCKRIVSGLLDFSRPAVPTRAPFDLQQVVEETLFLLQHHARVKRLAVETALADEPVTVIGAREQLVQVLIALLLNAADAMEEGGTIRVRVGRDERGDALLEVSDEGMGIEPADRTRIFDPFFTTKPPGRGTGLGLSICYGIVTEHDGRIEVESEPGKGSTFRVLLPVGEEP